MFMAKFNIFKPLVCAMLAVPMFSVAQQNMGSWANPNDTNGHNFYINYVGGRVIINSPSNLAGPVIHTISNDGRSGQWGGTIKGLSSPINDVEIVKADPYDGCGALINGSAVQGKIALIKRGSCEFGTKAKNAQAAGAVAVIIVNNVSGAPVGMGAGSDGGVVTIPVIMVSDLDGAAIETALGSGSVKMSMSTWGNGFNDDIGFVDRGVAGWHAYSIPLNQITGATALPLKGFSGAVIANYGNTTATSVKLKSTLSWTPTGGSTTIIRSDSVTRTNFAPSDSIITPFIDVTYNLNPTTTGRYDIDYEVIPNFVDQFPGDNKARQSFYVDNTIYSKGRYDFATGMPISGQGYRLGGTNPTEFTWGNFLYVEKADYQIESVQVSLSKENANTDNKMNGISPVQILVYKWVDNGDTIIAGPELTVVGYGQHAFSANDTSGQIHTISIADPIQASKPMVTEANTWYWVAAAVPLNTFLQVDGITNHFVRAWGRSHATDSIREPYSPLFPENFSNLGSATNPLQHFPFESYFFLEDSIRFSQQRNGLVPSLPVKMSLFKVGVDDVESAVNFDINLYPNPATDVLNVSLDLDKEAKEVYYTVMSITGTRIKSDRHVNVKNDTYTINTAELPAGNYMLIMSIDGENAMRKFSVIK